MVTPASTEFQPSRSPLVLKLENAAVGGKKAQRGKPTIFQLVQDSHQHRNILEVFGIHSSCRLMEAVDGHFPDPERR